MTEIREQNRKRAVIGIVAHVDAGKTTLTEALLYESKAIRKMGRVDHRDSFLDNFELERERGITIFSKQASLTAGNVDFTLIDTPGHADLSPETERCLRILDTVILVISGTEGVQAHTRTLWKLIVRYKLPCMIFVNKTDRALRSKEELLKELKTELFGGCTDFTQEGTAFFEAVAENDEALTEKFLAGEQLKDSDINRVVGERRVVPVYFGAALKSEGVAGFLEGLSRFVHIPERKKEAAAIIYKIKYDEKGERLSFAKVTGGTFKPRDTIESGEDGETEKISTIRLYNGAKFETLQEALPGQVVAFTGLKNTVAPMGIGAEDPGTEPLLVPALSRRIILPEGYDPVKALPVLKVFEEENPELSVTWDERLKEMRLGSMGDIQDEILKKMISDALGEEIELGPARVLYKETINSTVEGIGHFEPLRHYAEVHLLMEPGKRGSGITAESICSEDILERGFQRLVLTHISERTHRGVLTGAPLTDVSIKLVRGRANKKHTVGGDFRQAVYRAIRQGLMQAESLLLEPYYDFRIEVPRENLGRAMTDVEAMFGKCTEPEINGENAVLCGSAPVSTISEYPAEVTAYTRGKGSVSFGFGGYDICHNQAEVKALAGYDPDSDIKNPSSSVFCAHGAGFTVEWDKVRDYMHEEGLLFEDEEEEQDAKRSSRSVSTGFVGVEEIDAILARASSSNRKEVAKMRRRRVREKLPEQRKYTAKPAKEQYMLIDGYNLLFSDEKLTELSKSDLGAARLKLTDRISNFAGMTGLKTTLVFDAYRVENHAETIIHEGNIDVVFTKTAETADRYIERFSHLKASEFDICVVTSDLTEQVIIMGAGCRRQFSEEFLEELDIREQNFREIHGIKTDED